MKADYQLHGRGFDPGRGYEIFHPERICRGMLLIFPKNAN